MSDYGDEQSMTKAEFFRALRKQRTDGLRPRPIFLGSFSDGSRYMIELQGGTRYFYLVTDLTKTGNTAYAVPTASIIFDQPSDTNIYSIGPSLSASVRPRENGAINIFATLQMQHAAQTKQHELYILRTTGNVPAAGSIAGDAIIMLSFVVVSPTVDTKSFICRDRTAVKGTLYTYYCADEADDFVDVPAMTINAIPSQPETNLLVLEV